MREICFRSGKDDLYAWAADEQGPPILLYHGGTMTHVSTVRGLSTDHFTCIAPDIRGRGKSICPHPECHTWDQYAADVVALADHLGFDRVTVGGGSLGAGVALAVALRYPERIEGAILASPVWMGNSRPLLAVHERADAARAEIVDIVAHHGIAAGVDAWLDLLDHSGNMSLRETLINSWSVHDLESFKAFFSWRAASEQPFNDLEDLRALTMPIVVVPGTDTVHPRQVAEAYMAVLPNATFVEAPVEFDTERPAGDLRSPDPTTPSAETRGFGGIIGSFLASLPLGSTLSTRPIVHIPEGEDR